ncbi:chromosomal replication initiator protein DnaA, partial [bacterium]|nr:chromosomal replication initiator protein DnaA [bacterium]
FFIFISMDFAETWQAALGELELTLSKANFTTWFKNTYISSLDNERAVICVPNTFTKAWLEKKYHDSILKALRSVGSNGIREVCYKVEVKNTSPIPGFDHDVASNKQPETFSMEVGADINATTEPKTDSCLNPRYTFNNFVVGKTNELAHAAAMAVATKPGATYNPLFVYGGSGLGKTHLLHAIGSHLKSVAPEQKVLYVTCETFTNEFIQAVRGGRIKDFKDTYRNADLLLVDDIQFITGKEGTQEEFFHTFNALHQTNKQIVITSDRSPKDIQALESRLLSRFEWGMIADISCPDFETRVAILDSKLKAKNTPLASEIMNYIAGTIQSNVRELEGALNKILAYHQFKNTIPTLESVQCLLQSYLPTIPKRTISPKRLLEIVTHYFDISHEDLLGKCREQRLAFPRQVAMYLLRHEAKCSYPHIGNHLGGRDHTTAMHACSKIAELIKTDEQLKRDLSLIREKLYSGASG